MGGPLGWAEGRGCLPVWLGPCKLVGEVGAGERGTAGGCWGAGRGHGGGPCEILMLTKKLHLLKANWQEAKAPDARGLDDLGLLLRRLGVPGGEKEKGKKGSAGGVVQESDLAVLRQLLLEGEAAMWDVSEKVRASKVQRKAGEEGGEEGGRRGEEGGRRRRRRRSARRRRAGGAASTRTTGRPARWRRTRSPRE